MTDDYRTKICLFYKLNITFISVGKIIILKLMTIRNLNSSESNTGDMYNYIINNGYTYETKL
jgi:hypothetical protein